MTFQRLRPDSQGTQRTEIQISSRRQRQIKLERYFIRGTRQTVRRTKRSLSSAKSRQTGTAYRFETTPNKKKKGGCENKMDGQKSTDKAHPCTAKVFLSHRTKLSCLGTLLPPMERTWTLPPKTYAVFLDLATESSRTILTSRK